MSGSEAAAPSDSAPPAALGTAAPLAALPAVASPATRALAVAGVLLATVIFGGIFVAGRHGALAGLTPWDLVTLRVAVSGALFLPLVARLVARHGFATLGGIGWGRGLLLAMCGGLANTLVVLIGLHLSPANHGAVLNPGFTPIYGVLFSALLLGEPTPRGAWLGIPLSLAGLTLVAGAGFWQSGGATWLGDAILAASGALWVLFNVLMRRWGVAPAPATAVMNVLSAAAWLPGYALATGFRPLLAAPGAEVLGQALFQGVLHGALAVLLFTRGVQVLGAARTLMFPALVPVWGTLLAAAVLGERLTAPQWVGVAVVIGGMVAIGRGMTQRAPPAKSTG